MTLNIISWNVNGIRAAQKKGFLEWLRTEQPDILGVQETKARREQLDLFLLNPDGYNTYWNSAERPGYSGVAIFSKEKPIKITNGFGVAKFDSEGRAICAEYKDFFFLNIYFPNGKASSERLQYKMDFYAKTSKFVAKLKKKKEVIICGDYNTAHKEIDLARPKENENTSGFLPMERAWIDSFINDGQRDVFRDLHEREIDQYSWWDMKTGARARNVGWRIDYHFVSENLAKRVCEATILKSVLGSDHAPVAIKLK